MSYADAALDLTSVSVACLAGGNGAGKSALLDAVTWALWESARSNSDELVRLGEKEMWVEIVFALEGQIYRVHRSRQKHNTASKSTSKGTLEFQILDSGTWRSLTAGSMRETQRQIVDITRMDYDTFVNSVYLRQGKADEFTTKPPSERKQILSDILGLSYFELLKDLARQISRELKIKADLIEQKLAAMPNLEKQIDELKNKDKEIQALISIWHKKIVDAESNLSRLKHSWQEVGRAQERLQTGKARKEELIQDVARLEEQEAGLKDKLHQLSRLIERRAEIEAQAQEFAYLKHQVEILDQNEVQSQDLNNKRINVQSELGAYRERLTVQLEHENGQLSNLIEKQKHLQEITADKDKLQAAYSKFKEMVAREAKLSLDQEAFIQLSQRGDELRSIIQSEQIHLEAEIQQKAESVKQIESMLDMSLLLGKERSTIDHERQLLDNLECQFELIEEKGIGIKSSLELVGAEIKDLQRQNAENLAKIHELETHSHSNICPLCSGKIIDRSAVINRYQTEIHAFDCQIAELNAKSELLVSQRDALRQQYAEIKQNLTGRKALDTRIGQFNEKVAAIERSRLQHAKLIEEIAQLKERMLSESFAQVERASLINLKAEIQKLNFDPVIYANLQAQIRAQRHTEARFSQMEKDLCELRQLVDEIPQIQLKIESIQSQLEGESYGLDMRQRLSDLDQQLVKLNYNRNQHKQLQQQLAMLTDSSQAAKELEQAFSNRPALQESLNSCSAALEAKEEQIVQLSKDIHVWQGQLQESPSLNQEIEKLEAECFGWKANQQSLATQLAVIQSHLDQLDIEKSSLDKDKQEWQTINTELSDYNFLAEAFSKKGIQAVIIENAIPEIESESNRILSRLSDNQMHIALVTQQKTKSGSTVETLDLMIADELGTRSYELYSGGEAFKVNFAVRVALSRLLARRAGAKLETLIIDEGFGSQDELSRDRLVRVIGSIKNDFAKILVITHIAEIKEMFPNHIQVTKNGGQSAIQLVS